MEQPLILVFYINHELYDKDHIKHFVTGVNTLIESKNANIISFFLPTKDEERIECINPVLVHEADMIKINRLVDDIKTSFSIGDDINKSYDYDIDVINE